MGNEHWYAVIYFRNGATLKCAGSNDQRSTARTAQQLFDQRMRTASSPTFEPTRIEIIRER